MEMDNILSKVFDHEKEKHELQAIAWQGSFDNIINTLHIIHTLHIYMGVY